MAETGPRSLLAKRMSIDMRKDHQIHDQTTHEPANHDGQWAFPTFQTTVTRRPSYSFHLSPLPPVLTLPLLSSPFPPQSSLLSLH